MRTVLPAFFLATAMFAASCNEPRPETTTNAGPVSAVDTSATRILKKKAWIQASLGNYDKAIKEVTSVLRINPRDSEAYFMRFQFIQQTMDEPFTRRAVQDLREAANLGHPEARDILRRYVDY